MSCYSFWNSRLISKSDRDLSSLDSGYNEGDETHTNAKLGIKSRSRNSLPRSFGSMESISTIDQNVEYPDRVVKLYKADQTYKYFMIFKDLGKECHVTLLQLKTQEVARHLTLQDFELFRVIDPREYIYDVWEFGPEFSPNLAKFEEAFVFG
ncbi:predicted protein [Nematostella vectensis]|uniref:Uncharacterized protein n=1 Tax=Nematostella vectensis TaxID=45351 RepID=A7T9R8_NEMVE|nr:predicted protein [Nematostella vectensis]|eukprot:XP_001619356.1 hypothetical protein NEMVEDRAFT_v1g224266 [Nematostella vectensis]